MGSEAERQAPGGNGLAGFRRPLRGSCPDL